MLTDSKLRGKGNSGKNLPGNNINSSLKVNEENNINTKGATKSKLILPKLEPNVTSSKYFCWNLIVT